MLRLFRPQIEDLIRQRDKTISKWAEEHTDRDVFEDRELDISSTRRISIERQMERVNDALQALH